MAEPKDGLGQVVAALHDPAAGPAARARQLTLLGELGAGPAAEPAEPAEPERRGPGRPKGSRNRRTEEWTRYLLAGYGSPLEALAKVMRAGPQRLAGELGIDLVDGFDRWLRVCAELAPYLHQKQPTAVAVDGAPAAPLFIGVSQQFAAAMGVSPEAARGSLKIVFAQGVADASSDTARAQSNGGESNDAG
jgi:hypothetical protein